MSNIAATFASVKPGSSTAGLKPKPGTDGITTEKASSARPPWATGSTSGPIMSRKSTNDPGYVCTRRSGVASSSLEGMCRKWTVRPSISVRWCGYSFIRASWARQSKDVVHWSIASRSQELGTPYTQSSPGADCGRRVRERRFIRSSTSAWAMSTVKGRMLSEVFV